jgi:hypothetical protein
MMFESQQRILSDLIFYQVIYKSIELKYFIFKAKLIK